jgi:hypothetical protein
MILEPGVALFGCYGRFHSQGGLLANHLCKQNRKSPTRLLSLSKSSKFMKAKKQAEQFSDWITEMVELSRELRETLQKTIAALQTFLQEDTGYFLDKDERVKTPSTLRLSLQAIKGYFRELTHSEKILSDLLEELREDYRQAVSHFQSGDLSRGANANIK